VLHADFANFLVAPLHEQQAPVTSVLLIFVQAAVQDPEDVEPPSLRPTVGSMLIV
jgi:hypothetical protein